VGAQGQRLQQLIWGERRRWKSGGDRRAVDLEGWAVTGTIEKHRHGHWGLEISFYFFYFFYILYTFFFFIEHGSQSGSVGNHASPNTLKVLPLSLDSFRERALPSGMRRLRTRACGGFGFGSVFV